MSYVDEPQTTLVSYRAKSKFCEGFKLAGCGGVAFMDSVPTLWVHAGDMCEPGAAAFGSDHHWTATEIERAALRTRSGNS
jgi:hypothetical protein